MKILDFIDKLYIKGHINKEEWQRLRKKYRNEDKKDINMKEPPTIY